MSLPSFVKVTNHLNNPIMHVFTRFYYKVYNVVRYLREKLLFNIMYLLFSLIKKIYKAQKAIGHLNSKEQDTQSFRAFQIYRVMNVF